MQASSHPGTRRDRRIQRKRQEIIEAATRVFSQKGYAATTTRDIANAADIGESTLYNYFPGKRDILLAAAEKTTQMVDAVILEAKEMQSREGLVNVADQAFAALTDHQYLTATILFEAMIDNEILQGFVIPRLNAIASLLRVVFEAHEARGEFRPFDPDLAARMALGIFGALLLPIMRGIEPIPTPEQRRSMAEASISLLFDGLAATNSTRI
jgi:AcrR family transcriptional regulator